MKTTKKGRSRNSRNLIAFRLTREIAAPIKYVYNWCTDFSEDDPRITGSSSKRLILEKTRDRAIYASVSGNSHGRIYLVKLRPPDSWHMEAHGNGFDSTADYRLKRVAANRTRLAISFRQQYYSQYVPPREERVRDSNESWDKYVAALEADYRKSAQ